MDKRRVLTLLAVFFYAAPLAAIHFGTLDYYHPYEFKKLRQTEADLADIDDEAFDRAIKATLYIGGAASAFLVSKDGLVMTAAHAIRHLYVGKTKNCSKLAFVMNHELLDEKTRAKRVILKCEEILEYDYQGDFVLIKVRRPKGIESLPYIPLSREIDAADPSVRAFVIGHPYASKVHKSHKRISWGDILINFPRHPELPHFLHIVDTEGGHSGAPVVNAHGELIGLHFRGVVNYGPGVWIEKDGIRKKVYRFNVALSAYHLWQKYHHYFND